MTSPLSMLTEVLQANNILLLIALVTVFFVGYKVLQTVVQLLVVAVTSGAFLAAISYVGMGPEINVSNIFAFMIVGVSLYIIFNSIQVASSIIERVWSFIKSLVPSSNDSKQKNTSKTGNQKKVILTEVEDDE